MTSAAATRSSMTQRCAVERDGAATDDEGNPAAPAWSSHIASLSCRFFHGTAEREVIDSDRSVVVEDSRMYVPLGTDITEADRINGVTDRLGNAIHSGLFNIRAVTRRATHLELLLQGAAA